MISRVKLFLLCIAVSQQAQVSGSVNCLSEYDKLVVNRAAQVDGYLMSGQVTPSIVGEVFTQGEYRSVYVYSTRTIVVFRNAKERGRVYHYGYGARNREEAIEDLQKMYSWIVPPQERVAPKVECGFAFKSEKFRIGEAEGALIDRYFDQTHLAPLETNSGYKILGIFSLDSRCSVFYVFLEGERLLSHIFDAEPEVQYRHYADYSNENRARLRQRITRLRQIGMLRMPMR